MKRRAFLAFLGMAPAAALPIKGVAEPVTAAIPGLDTSREDPIEELGDLTACTWSCPGPTMHYEILRNRTFK
jgi:hypothetical protein